MALLQVQVVLRSGLRLSPFAATYDRPFLTTDILLDDEVRQTWDTLLIEDKFRSDPGLCHKAQPAPTKNAMAMGEGEGGMFREDSIETCILSRVKQITSPGWMHETSTRGWCTGKTQRDRVEREVGGGIGMGNTWKSMADSCQCMAKTTTIL